ncbi:MAG: hypothetical protein SF182_18975 [Deltaproteobacteria bacterium]|nr:hypothetical protein [Deltaproteobacteria bacterium]
MTDRDADATPGVPPRAIAFFVVMSAAYAVIWLCALLAQRGYSLL